MRSAKVAVALAVAAILGLPGASMAQPTGSVLADEEWAPEDLVVTDAEREAAEAAAAGGLAGVIVPSLAYGYFRTVSESASEALEAIGMTVETCEAVSAAGLDAGDCFTDLVERGARVIILSTIPAESAEAASAAIADGTVIVQINIANLSEAGAPRVAVEPTTHEGLAAVVAETAAALWGEAPVNAVLLGDPALPGFEGLATQVEDAIADVAPQVTVTGHLPGRLPKWAQDSVAEAVAGEAPPDLVVGLVEFGVVSASASHPSVAFVSHGCTPAAATALAAGGNYKGCIRSFYPEETGTLAAALATKLIAGGEAPGAVLIPATPMVQSPMSSLGDVVVSPPDADDPRLAACATRVGMLPSELDGESLNYQFVNGYSAVESGEIPADVLVRLHLASGSGLSEDDVCLVRFAYGDGSAARGTLWDIDGDFNCPEDASPAACQMDRYVASFTEIAAPGPKAKASRPRVAGRRVAALKLPGSDLFAVRVGSDLPVREVILARTGDTFATFAGRKAAEAVLPSLPEAS